MPDIVWDAEQPGSGIVWDDKPGVSQDIINKVEWVESKGNPNAVSRKGAVGSMQTMPNTLRDPGYGVAPARNNTAEELKRVGVDYLNAMYRKYGDMRKALAAYNWGPGNVDAAVLSDPSGWEKKLPKETKNYVSKIAGAKDTGIVWDTDQQPGIVWDEKPSSLVDTGMDVIKGMGQNLVGKGETALSAVSGLLATPVAGLAGLFTSGMGLYPEQGAQTVENVSNALTYRPQTERGQQEAAILNKPLELLDQGTGWLGQYVSDLTGSPALGAVTKAGTMFGLPVVGGKVIKGLSKGKAPVRPTVETPVKSSEIRPVEVLDESKVIAPAEPPPVQEGYVRLYRGHNGGWTPVIDNPPLYESLERGRWFSTDRDATTFYGPTRYVDVPQAVADASIVTDSMYNKTGRLIPAEWANKSIPLEKYEAYVKGGSTSPTPKYAEGSAINLERLGTTQDVKQLVNQLAKDNETKIGKKAITWEESQQAARDLAWDEKDFLTNARTKNAFSASEIDAMRQIHTNAASDLQKTLREIPADRSQLTDAMRLELMDKVNNYVEIMKATSTKSSEAGRALNIHKRMVVEDPDFMANTNMQKAMKQIMDKKGGRKLTDDLIRDLKDVDWKDAASVKNIIKKYNKASPGDMVYEAWLNGILSNPTTHSTNILSNALTVATKVPEHAVASAVRGKLPFGEVRAETIGMIQGLKEGVRAGLKAFKTGEASEMWNKVETARTPAIPGTTGEVIRIPTKALTGADEFFKAIVYRSELNRLAYLEAKKSGAKGNAIPGKMAEYLDNPTPEMLESAHQEALYRTFNKPLGRMGNRIMALRSEVPGAKYLFPFVRTPANIAKYTLERTPLGLGKIALEMKRGNLTKADFADRFARSAIGTTIGTVVYQMAKEGTITGGGPKSSAERETLYRTGWQPYSIKVGDSYYPYNRFEPLGSIMGLASDISDVSNMDADAKTDEKFSKMAMSISKNITSKTFMQGLSGLLDATSDPDRYGDKFVKQLAGSVVPSVVAGATRATDSTVYETKGPIEAVKARIGMTGEMLPKRDIWGREVERPGTPATRFLSPSSPSPVKDDPVDIEMNRLKLAIPSPSKKVRGVELEPAEYDAYSRRAGELSRERVERYMSSKAYSLMRDELKKLAVKNIIEKSRTQAGIEIWKDMERGRRFKPIDKKYGTSLAGTQ